MSEKIKIILYGMGQNYRKNQHFFEEEFEVVGCSDLVAVNASNYIEPHDIKKYVFDYVVITSNKYFDEIKEQLLRKKYAEHQDKILSVVEILKLKYEVRLNSKGGSSASDKDLFPEFCFAASRDEEIFRNFKRNPIYTVVLEHVSEKQGEEYLKVILGNKRQKLSETEWEYIKKNDLFGNPYIYEYIINGGRKWISPTTLRYTKVLLDIKDMFDFSAIRHITEIGVGYGGQCRILCMGGDKRYTLVDLPEVLELAKRYLGSFSDEHIDNISYVDGTKEFNEVISDLVISNYAFSELIKSVQDIYLEKIIKRSKRGYITWNSVSYKQMDGYSIDELLEKIPRAKVIEEKPLTAVDNCIIVWGL